MTYHTESFFLALISLLNIFMSIPVTLVIYTYVVGVTYFSSLHLSVVIIIVGIGSDDIFVFHDFWRSTFSFAALKNKPVLRLSLAFRRASHSMLVTSITSMVAFASCIMSNIMPIKSFGVFATIIVPLVYLQTILVQPFTYYFYEKYLINCKLLGLIKLENPRGRENANKELNMTKEPLEVLPDEKVDYSEFILQTEDMGKV